MITRPLRLLGSALLLLVLTASPALADPAGPTNYLTELSTDTLGVATVEVFGGDSFLVMEVPAGHTAVVHGYAHDPANGVVDNYLRFDADGSVWVNERSEAKWLNEERYGQTVVPSDIGPDLPPSWVQVGAGGAYSWHDHRIHWMSPDLPPRIDPAGGVQTVLTSTVPITVDDEPMELEAVVTWRPAPGPLPWLALAVLAIGGAAVFGRQGAGLRAVLLGVAVVAGVVASVGNVVGLPAGVPPEIAPLLLPLAGAVVLAASFLVQGRARDAMVGAAALPVVVGTVLGADALTASFVPSVVPVALVQSGVVVAGGLALGVVVALLGEVFSADLGAALDRHEGGSSVPS